jgi:hypothetical protein
VTQRGCTPEKISPATIDLCLLRTTSAGMWELPRYEHYTTSKIGCWQALRCAVHLAEIGQTPGDPERWAREADPTRRLTIPNPLTGHGAAVAARPPRP